MATARDYNFVVAVHAHGAEGMKRAIRAGVDSVEHGTYMDSEAMNLMKEHGTWYVPTISAGKWVARSQLMEGKLPNVVRPRPPPLGRKYRALLPGLLSRVPIAFGTDAGVSHTAPMDGNLRLWWSRMPVMEALRAATVNAAMLLRWKTKWDSSSQDT